ncbi:MAG: hypothetical protein IPO95_09810 [Rhodanobacteraceae bacterium]|nr:hypothetical protein [Rhodanobacteraceae bacterium]
MRYTEARMARLTHELMADIDKETVDFTPNYDEKELEPTVLPTRVPNLLINGSAGIAVGMATNIPPHNLGEVIDATLAVIDDPEISIDTLMQHVPGPDFPTAGIINGSSGIIEAYRTGRGRILVRAKADIEDRQRWPRVDHRHRDAVPGEQGAADREDRRAGQGKEDRGHLRAARRVRQGRHAHLHRGQARRVGRGAAQQPLPADADGVGVRHQHGGLARRPAEGAEPQGDPGRVRAPSS